jgi:phosphoribosyl 1,2-cyclic phosphodiesterase
MKVHLWGVRGSIPTTDPDTAFYGGNTSCVDVWDDGWLLVLDGGSGIARLKLQQELGHKRIDILLSHLHLDHIQGLGFFRFLFDPAMEIHIWGPSSSTITLHSRLSRYLSPPLFPVLIRDLPCKLHLHEVENSEFEIGPFQITSRYVIHPGPTVGYRINSSNSTFTYIPDHEPALGPNGLTEDKRWISGIDLARDTNLLFHDAQYTSEEYTSKRGWGHSSVEDAARFASLAGVKHLLFAHHDPTRTDKQLAAIYDGLKKNHKFPFHFDMAREGMELQP